MSIMNLIRQNYLCIYYITGIHVFTDINMTSDAGSLDNGDTSEREREGERERERALVKFTQTYPSVTT